MKVQITCQHSPTTNILHPRILTQFLIYWYKYTSVGFCVQRLSMYIYIDRTQSVNHFQCITPRITECLCWVSGLVFWIEPVLEMCAVQSLKLVLPDGSNWVGVTLPFSTENRQQIQSPRPILFRIQQCTEFTNPVTLNILLPESFRNEVNITPCSLLWYFHVTGDNILVFSVKKFSLAYTSTPITFKYNVLTFNLIDPKPIELLNSTQLTSFSE
jgi:hypothetical protein